MKKLLIFAFLVLVPGAAQAAYNDVSLATTTVLEVNSITLNLTASGATVESAAIGSETLVLTIESGSSFKISAPGLNQLYADSGAGRTLETCNSTESVLEYHLSGTQEEVVVTITPLATLCADPAAPSSSASSGSNSPAAVRAHLAAMVAPAYSPEITALLDRIAQLQAQIRGITGEVPPATTPAALPLIPGGVCPYVWTRTLTTGSTGEDVMKLQQFLNMSSDTAVAASGPGSAGSETTRFGPMTAIAVSKFQEKYASEILTPAGLTTGTGRFAAGSRAKANALCQ